MRKKPSHIAFIIIPGKDDLDGRIWKAVGAVWPHRQGRGFDVVLNKGVSVKGRIVCHRPKKNPERKESGK